MKQIQRFIYWFFSSFRSQRSRTVRLAFPLVFVSAALLGATALLYEDTSYIRIETTENIVAANERFSIDVFVGANTPVNAVDIAVEFPVDQIEVEGIDTGESVITLWTQDPYVAGNEVILQGGTFRKGFLGEHRIATINARALEEGQAEFTTDSITLLAGDGTGAEIEVTEVGRESVAIRVEAADGIVTGDVAVVIVTDIDGDGNVDFNDILSFLSAWRSQKTIYDFNNDNRMTFVDFSIILADSFLR